MQIGIVFIVRRVIYLFQNKQRERNKRGRFKKEKDRKESIQTIVECILSAHGSLPKMSHKNFPLECTGTCSISGTYRLFN